MEDIRIATVIAHAPVFRIDENLEKMGKFVRAAKARAANIICFPEMNITGYTTRIDVFPSIRMDSEKILQKLIRMARQNDMVILSGFAEMDGDGHIFASHAVVKPDGDVGLYRKLYLAPPEKGVFNAASDIPVFEACHVRFGIQLCYDAHFPELSSRMARSGADIIFIPHASPKGTPEEKYLSWSRHLPARAYDNSLFIVACNQTGDNGAGLSFPGIAVVFGPSGELIDRDISGKEGMIVTDLKQEVLEKVRGHRMRYFLPNRRDDLFPG
ncbi:MAG: nitrilase-related carbon-nitrogen hydrolase [Pseudomonadota bacterium]